MSINPETLRLLAASLSAANSRIDQRSTELLVAYVNSWSSVQAALADAVQDSIERSASGRITPAAISRERRLRDALKMVEGELTRLAADSADQYSLDVSPIVEAAQTDQMAMLGSQLPADQARVLLSLDKVDRRQLDAMVARTISSITASTNALPAAQLTLVRSELVRAVARGSNPRVAAMSIVNRSEGAFLGGYKRAELIARTEILDAYRSAASAVDKANADVVSEWVWISSLSTRTCPSCISKHGSAYPITEDGPHDHPNGRCSRVTRVKPWEQLGFPGMVEPDDAIPDAQTWFNAQTPEVQLDMLGKARYAAWRAGDYPMDKWSMIRHNEDWRDSWVVSPPPKTR